MKLIVGPASHAAHGFDQHKPSHVLGILSPGQDEIAFATPPSQRLELRFNDIATHQYGLVMPSEADLRAILKFAAAHDKTAPMLIYCFAGISRSTAAAFVIACQQNPHVAETDIAKALREASPHATPNPLMVALADALLQREGRMSAAISAIGRGADFIEGRAFELNF